MARWAGNLGLCHTISAGGRISVSARAVLAFSAAGGRGALISSGRRGRTSLVVCLSGYGLGARYCDSSWRCRHSFVVRSVALSAREHRVTGEHNGTSSRRYGRHAVRCVPSGGLGAALRYRSLIFLFVPICRVWRDCGAISRCAMVLFAASKEARLALPAIFSRR